MILAITFWMKIIQYHYHPLLDDSCHQFLDENYMKKLIPYWMILAITLDKIYVKKLSSLIG